MHRLVWRAACGRATGVEEQVNSCKSTLSAGRYPCGGRHRTVCERILERVPREMNQVLGQSCFVSSKSWSRPSISCRPRTSPGGMCEVPCSWRAGSPRQVRAHTAFGSYMRATYRDTSLIRTPPPVGHYSSICLGPYGGPRGGAGRPAVGFPGICGSLLARSPERAFFFDNLLARVHHIDWVTWLTGLAPWES